MTFSLWPSFGPTSPVPDPGDVPSGNAGPLPGTPTLFGPFVVEYTDVLHDYDKHTLWVPAIGDVLLRLFPDVQTAVDFKHGGSDTGLYIGQQVDASTNPPINSFCWIQGGTVQGLDMGYEGAWTNALGVQGTTTTWIFKTTDPVQIQHGDVMAGPPGGADLTAGHVELYALIARAAPPA